MPHRLASFAERMFVYLVIAAVQYVLTLATFLMMSKRRGTPLRFGKIFLRSIPVAAIGTVLWIIWFEFDNMNSKHRIFP